MSPFQSALISDKHYIKPSRDYKHIDSTGEVNKGDLENRLQYEYVLRLLTDSYRQFFDDYLPGGKDSIVTFPGGIPHLRNNDVCNVHLWDGYVICTSTDSRELSAPERFEGRDFSPGSDYFGQWVNIEERVCGDNLLELFIYHSKNHPRDAHKILARRYGWDLSPDAIFLRNKKFDYRQSPTVSPQFDWRQPLKFLKELDGWPILHVYEYRNRTGALRGVMVRCESPDKERIVSIPVVQYERLNSIRQDEDWPTQGPIPRTLYQLRDLPPRPAFQADIGFFEAPYPLYNEHLVNEKNDEILIIAHDEWKAEQINRHLDKVNERDYCGISWPGGKSTVNDTDWWSLEGRKIGFFVENNDKNMCLLAYATYKSVTKVNPAEFNFHVLKNSLPESLEGSISFSNDTRSLMPNEFVKYVWEKFDIALEDWIKPAPKAYTVEEILALDVGESSYTLTPILLFPATAEIFAHRGTGKTYFALELAKTCATGKIAFERWTSPVPRNVLYIDGEMSIKGLAKRIKLLDLKQAGDKLKILSASTLGHPIKDLSTPEGQADAERWLKKYKPEVIFIDNLATLAPRALGNDAECCIPLNTWVQGLKCRGYAVVLIHHAGKGNGGRGGVQRGSSTKEDMLDLVISLEVPKQKRNQAHFDVVFTKTRDVYGEDIEPFSLTLTTVKSEDGQSISAHWEVGEKSNGKIVEAKPKAPVRPAGSPEEDQRRLNDIENLYRTTKDNEGIIAGKVGFNDRSAMNRFLDKFPDDKKRIKSIRPSIRPANKRAAPSVTSVTIDSEPISTVPN